jgi:hypothetical protein
LRNLSLIDVRSLLKKLGPDLTDAIVVIGGQAVAFWAEIYRNELPEDLRAEPLTSKDLDFEGDKAAVRLTADRLGGEAFFPDLDDPTPNVGVVKYVDESGEIWGIDFLEVPFGLKSAQEVFDRAQRLEVLDEEGGGSGQFFLILNPIHALLSRVANVAALPGGNTSQGLNQLRAAISSCRAFVKTVLSEYDPRKALKLNEEVFEIAISMHGQTVFQKYRIDPMEAVLLDDHLPGEFRVIRYPQMLEQFDGPVLDARTESRLSGYPRTPARCQGARRIRTRTRQARLREACHQEHPRRAGSASD